jgi:serine/threonine protein kinase
MFEFMCGAVPFGELAEDPMDVYLAIINDKMTIPAYCKDKDFKCLISLMLSKNPLNRLYKLSDIINNIFFKDFSWDNLISLNCEPAYKPEITKDIFEKDQLELTSFLDVKKNYLKKYYFHTVIIINF